MTQEEKNLLLKDICARLPYGVKIQVNNKIEILEGIGIPDNIVEYGSFFSCEVGEVKPFLFPLSSMTEEKKKEYYNLCIEEEREEREFGEWITKVYYHNTIESIDWLNKKHFDYRGLIKKGLAIDCTNLDIY